MSFEEFGKRMAGTPELDKHAAERAQEDAHQKFHAAFLKEVYPWWQGPMTLMSKSKGIESVTHSPVAGAQMRLAAGFMPITTEIIQVNAVQNLSAFVAYQFSGDENDGQMRRVAGFAENGMELGDDMIKSWSGPLASLVEAAVADVEVAQAFFGPLLMQALNTRTARLKREAEEKAAREKAEAEAKAAKEKAEAEEIERQKTAALTESKRLEDEKKAAGEKKA